MAVTVAEIIEGARDFHASLDPHAHPDSVFIRFLDRYHKRLVLKVAQINPDEISSFQTISLPLATFDNGAAANDAHQYYSGKAFFLNASDLWDRVEILPWESRDRPTYFPAVSLVNGVIRLHGVAEDWTAYGSLELRYVPMTTKLDDGADTIVLPDTALDCLSLAAAHFGMRRQPEQPYKTFFAELRAEWMEAEGLFLGEIAGRMRAHNSQINEVW
jgi:hypothetical protein